LNNNAASETVAVPPKMGWLQVTAAISGMIRAAGLDGQAVMHESSKEWAPIWASAIAGSAASPRNKILALKKCARDPETTKVVTTLMLCTEASAHTDIVTGIANEFMQTLHCVCGAVFDSTAVYAQHIDYECPKRKLAMDKL